MKWPVSGAILEGAMRMFDGEAPFARAAVILRSADGSALLRARKWGHDDVIGDPLTEEDLGRFVDTRQAMRWRDLGADAPPAAPEMAVWILRPGFEELISPRTAIEEIKQAQALIADVSVKAPPVTVLVVREDRAEPVRARWATSAFDSAWQEAAKGRWQRACALAELSFVVDRSLVPERVALFALALEQCGEKTDADGTLIMAEESRGPAFGSEMRARLEEYRKQLLAPAREIGREVHAGAGVRPGQHGMAGARAGLGPSVHKSRQATLRKACGLAA